MFYRFSVLAVVLAIGAGGLLADDKKDAKKDSTEVKGTVVKFDMEKRCITLKANDKEKGYALGESVYFEPSKGKRVPVLSKSVSRNQPRMRMLVAVLKPGTEVTLVLEGKENAVREIHVELQPSQTGKPAAPPAKPATPTAKPSDKTDTQK